MVDIRISTFDSRMLEEVGKDRQQGKGFAGKSSLADDVFVMMKKKQQNSVDLSSEHKSSFDFPK